ncbi:MAG: hypothetical protein IJ206_04255 [Oscillospiraceae bacterium]|nr:hypothetical protein [Oscillospiraceae bacterium]
MTNLKITLFRLAALCLAILTLSGCGLHFNVNDKLPSAEELLRNQNLTADPVEYNPEGTYSVIFRSDKGGFEKMDLSKAYVAYYPVTVEDQIDAVVGEDADDVPPLPADAQSKIDEVTGAGELSKIAVVTIETVDDRTLKVSFTDKDNPVSGKEYFFIIPNEGLAGSVLPE